MTTVIEKGVPLTAVSGKGRPMLYPTADMVKGDSFFIARPLKECAYVAAQANRRYPTRRYVSRTVEGGTRVWRVK